MSMAKVKQFAFRQLGFVGAGMKDFLFCPETVFFWTLIGLGIAGIIFLAVMAGWSLLWVRFLNFGNTGFGISLVCTFLTFFWFMGLIKKLP